MLPGISGLWVNARGLNLPSRNRAATLESFSGFARRDFCIFFAGMFSSVSFERLGTFFNANH
jgi:hypothetical protein